MYAGEGIASKGNQIGDRKMVWVNFEEGTVPTSQLQGADGELAIVTPASPNDITKYYQWKRRRIQRGLK